MKWTTFSGILVAGSAALFVGRNVLLPRRMTPEEILEDVARRSKLTGSASARGCASSTARSRRRASSVTKT